MRDRPAVFVRLTDASGHSGFGEIWCNFPHVGAGYRKRLADEVVGPILKSLDPAELDGTYEVLMARLHLLAIQSGDWGPLRQVCAGFDAAVHDLAARRADAPLYACLNPDASAEIGVYASGIGPERPGEVARSFAEAGHRAFKVKVGFGVETDLASAAAFRRSVGNDVRLMVDANQGWNPGQATEMIGRLAPAGLVWVEEPIAADQPVSAWQKLGADTGAALAAGENLNTTAEFQDFMNSAAVRFIQPDVAKWGGVSGCLAVGRLARESGAVYCPHFLGGGIGLASSAHLLAAVGGQGLLEVDTNPNPLRDRLLGDAFTVVEGRMRLGDRPGIGIDTPGLFG